jgi:hypothetical protein
MEEQEIVQRIMRNLSPRSPASPMPDPFGFTASLTDFLLSFTYIVVPRKGLAAPGVRAFVGCELRGRQRAFVERL